MFVVFPEYLKQKIFFPKKIQGAKGSRIQVKGMEGNTLESLYPRILEPCIFHKNQ